MKKKYNLIVAGAGTAGLMAAWKAAEKGLKVLVVEKKNNLCEALRTTGNTFRNRSPINGDYVTVEKKNGKAVVHFNNSNFDVPYSGRLIETFDSYTFSNSGHIVRTTRKDRPMAYVYNMEIFLQDLKEQAQEAGVSFMTGTIALGIEHNKNSVKLKVKQRERTSWIEADRLIAADGLNSRIVESLGLNKERPVVVRGPCFETVFEGVDFPYPPGFSFVLGNDMRGGAGFMFVYPHAIGENSFAVMVNRRFPAELCPRMIDHFITKSLCADWFNNARPVHHTEAIVTVRPPINPPYAGNVLFIGDAAAFGETLVPGALRCGYHAADAVVQELGGEKGFEGYGEFWATNFDFVGNPQKQKDYTKILRLYNALSDSELDFLFKLSEERGPIEMEGESSPFNEYTAGYAMIDHFMGFSEVQGELRDKLQMIRDS